MELRCGSKILHCEIDGDVLKVACRSRWCGKRKGTTVIHHFNIQTGTLIETRRFADPTTKNEVTDQHARQGTPLRSA